jgi:hypothetical protein
MEVDDHWREKGSSLNCASLTTKPLASSVNVHVLEAPSPLKQSISVSVMYLFPSQDIERQRRVLGFQAEAGDALADGADAAIGDQSQAVHCSIPKCNTVQGRASRDGVTYTVPPAKQAGEASRRGKDAFLDQFPPEPNTMIEIDLQDADGGTTLRR